MRWCCRESVMRTLSRYKRSV